MTKMPSRRPFDEADLRDGRRPHPLHFRHLFRCDAAAPARRLGVRQVDERTSVDVEWLQLGGDLAAQARREAGAHLAGEAQLPAVVIADEQRVDSAGTRTIAADDELLLLVEFQLEPGCVAIARCVS